MLAGACVDNGLAVSCSVPGLGLYSSGRLITAVFDDVAQWPSVFIRVLVPIPTPPRAIFDFGRTSYLIQSGHGHDLTPNLRARLWLFRPSTSAVLQYLIQDEMITVRCRLVFWSKGVL